MPQMLSASTMGDINQKPAPARDCQQEDLVGTTMATTRKTMFNQRLRQKSVVWRNCPPSSGRAIDEVKAIEQNEQHRAFAYATLLP